MKTILKFTVGDIPYFDIEVDVEARKMLAFNEYGSTTVKYIFPEERRHFLGMERQLQFWMESKGDMPVLLERVKQEGLNVPDQINLNLEVLEED